MSAGMCLIKNMKKNNQNQKFPGFPPEPSMNFWSYPKALNGYWHQLSGSEQKALDYILRHTWGFDKTADEISLTQLEKGIKNFDGGTGLCRPTIIAALKGLIKKGFISKRPGKKANRYELVKNFNYLGKKSLLFDSKKSLHTIDNLTINNKQYNPSSKKPYFRGNLLFESPKNSGKWWLYEKGEKMEFAGREFWEEVEWK